MTMDGTFTEPWADGEARESKLVFIGKNLDADELAASFNECLATPKALQLKREALRFAVGDQVECKVSATEWAAGEVVVLMYRDDAMPPGQVAPYQVRLHRDSCLIWASYDEDDLIRMPRRRSIRVKGTGRGADDAPANSCDGDG